MKGGAAPLLARDHDDPVALRNGRIVAASEFLAHANGLAELLPAGAPVINVCANRYEFLAGFGAAVIRGSPTLLPPNPLAGTIDAIHREWPGSVVLADVPQPECTAPVLVADPTVTAPAGNPSIPGDRLAAVAFTSGSTGPPRPQAKSWRNLVGGIAVNRDYYLGRDRRRCWLVSTVPAQHMYGFETSVMSVLHASVAMHDGRPFYPDDVRAALAMLPEPGILVSTPMHLQALVGSGLAFPRAARVLSATAPIDTALARAVERLLGAELVEIYGCTEVGSVAWRRTADSDRWRILAGLEPHLGGEATFIRAAHLESPVRLPDLLEFAQDGSFALAGRDGDLVKVGGKRSSLGELTRHLLAIPGVTDAVVFKPPGAGDDSRIAALVVSATLDAAAIRSALRPVVDAVFIPRPLHVVPSLPRSASGKLPREAVTRLLQSIDIAGSPQT